MPRDTVPDLALTVDVEKDRAVVRGWAWTSGDFPTHISFGFPTDQSYVGQARDALRRVLRES